jgi:hypothetical protein
MTKTKERVQNQYLKSFKAESEKFLPDAPLSKKPLAVMIEQPIQDLLNSMPSKKRITFVRKALGEALVREGLLAPPNHEQ